MFKTKIKEIKEVTENTFYLSVERPENFVFQNGQYLNLCLEDKSIHDPKGLCRIFSIASSERNTDSLSFLFRKSGSPFKEALISLKPGEFLSLSKSIGSFLVPKKGEHIFIAGGVGIAPFLGTIFDLPEKVNITLLYANRSPESSAFLPELEKIAKEKENFRLKKVFGKIEKTHLQGFVGKSSALFWIVGPPAMTDELKALLSSMGVPEDYIKHEGFVGY